MSDPLVIPLAAGAVFQVWPAARFCQTVYTDGRTVPAAPQDDPGYAEKARALGYDGADPAWRMCVEHELLHSLLAAPAVSPTLRDVATGRPASPAHWDEEARVLDAQRALNAVRGVL